MWETKENENNSFSSGVSQINSDILNDSFGDENELERHLISKKEKILNNKRVRNKPNKNKFIKNFIKAREYLKIIEYIILIGLFILLTSNNWRKFELKFSNITLKIKGIGNNYVLGYCNEAIKFPFEYFPNEIYINKIFQDKKNYSYYFAQEDNLVELVWYNNINISQNMFCGCSNAIEIDFSNFNFSSASDMSFLFCNCSSLISLNLFKFDTSKVTSMSNMFKGCSSLTSLNLSNFNTFQVTHIDNLFADCTYLEYINF